MHLDITKSRIHTCAQEYLIYLLLIEFHTTNNTTDEFPEKNIDMSRFYHGNGNLIDSTKT